MSVIVAVNKNGVGAIAADTELCQGTLRIAVGTQRYPSKIIAIGNAYVGISGSAAHLSVMRSLAKAQPEKFDLSSPEQVFETFRRIHPILREEYYVMTKEDDADQPYESNQMMGLVLSPSGLFGFHGYREVSEYENFWAEGSGQEVALGALEVLFGSARTATEIAVAAIEVTCKFNNRCGLPVVVHEMRVET